MSLSNRQWNQIRAALAFWRAVAETSRVHPIKHPAVQPYFGDDRPTPLMDDEIEAILMLPTPPDGPGMSTINKTADHFGVVAATLRFQLKRMGEKPVFKLGGVHFYEPTVLAAAVRVIQERDKAFRKRYHVGQ